MAYVYDVASLTRLGTYTSPSAWWARLAWVPSGQHVLVSWRAKLESYGQKASERWGENACLWDYRSPEAAAPPAITVDDAPGLIFRGWSPGGSSYYVVRSFLLHGSSAHAFEERRVADGSVVHSAGMRTESEHTCLSPDARALLTRPSPGFPMRIVLFD